MTDLSFAALRSTYTDLWKRVIVPGGVTRPMEAQEQAQAILEPIAARRFRNVELMTDVPWFVTGIISTRESGSPPNFHAWLYNGDPMFDHTGTPRRTTHEPAHQPQNPDCSWEEGCADSYKYDGVLHKSDWSPEYVAFLLEKYNGFGYRLYHHIPSPYLWGGTVVQQRGKYVRDGHWDASIMDPQIGGMALLATLMELDPEIKFTTKEA